MVRAAGPAGRCPPENGQGMESISPCRNAGQRAVIGRAGRGRKVMNKVLRMDPIDNLATCLVPIAKGTEVEVDGIRVTALEDIPQYHKIALCDIARGDVVYKYGQVIGLASRDIAAGAYAHTHNVESTRGRGDRAKEDAACS